MKLVVLNIFLVLGLNALAQDHKKVIDTINTLEEAEAYAAKYSEVSMSMVNPEKDGFLFDHIDTSNMQQHIGETTNFFGRSTKLLKDTVISMVNIQVIAMDLSKVSLETAELLLKQMKKRLANEETYWDLRKKYGHTSAIFSSGPELTSVVSEKYSVNLVNTQEQNVYDWKMDERENKIGIFIVAKIPHDVPAFYSISYNSNE